MKLNHKGLEAAIDAAVKDAPDGGIELDIGAAITAYLQAVGPEPAVAVKPLEPIFEKYLSSAENVSGPVPSYVVIQHVREMIGEIRSALVATPPAERVVEAQIREVANLAFDALFNTAGASLARSVQQKILALAAKPAVKDDETVVETVKRWPERGDKMRFLGRNGYDQELERARRAFAIDTDYTVSRIEIGSWSSNLYFEEVEGSWNSVMFDFAPATLAAKDGRS